MTDSDFWRYDDLRGRLRGLLIALADQLPPVTAGLVDELIDANECGVALEMLSEMLVESDARLSSNTLAIVATAVKEMNLDSENVERLRPLVTDARADPGSE